MTRRVQRLYAAVLSGAASAWYWPHPQAFSSGIVSGPQWQAFLFARDWGGRDGVDLKRLEGIVARGPDPVCIVEFAKVIPSANVRRLQREVVARGQGGPMRSFLSVKGANAEALRAAILVAEVMEQ